MLLARFLHRRACLTKSLNDSGARSRTWGRESFKGLSTRKTASSDRGFAVRRAPRRFPLTPHPTG